MFIFLLKCFNFESGVRERSMFFSALKYTERSTSEI